MESFEKLKNGKRAGRHSQQSKTQLTSNSVCTPKVDLIICASRFTYKVNAKMRIDANLRRTT